MYRIFEMFDGNFHIDDNRLNNNNVTKNCPKKFVHNHAWVHCVEMVREYYMDQVWIWYTYRLIMEWSSKQENDRLVSKMYVYVCVCIRWDEKTYCSSSMIIMSIELDRWWSLIIFPLSLSFDQSISKRNS